MITARPSRDQSSISDNRSASVDWSMAVKGSSSRTTGASWTMVRANSARCSWPADRVWSGMSASEAVPVRVIAASMAARPSRSIRPPKPSRDQAPISTISRSRTGTLVSNSERCPRKAICDGFSPCQAISPPITGRVPRMVFTSVDLPDPLCPTTASTSPADTSNETLLTTACPR